MQIADIQAGFKQIYQELPSGYYFAPGRINLIGEHTDYNGGHVFPCAISLGLYGAASPRVDRKFRLYSTSFVQAGVIEVDLDQLRYVKEDGWANYAKGMIHFLLASGYQLDHGLNVYVDGNIPDGAGLSSSAALEMLVGTMIEDQFHLSIDHLTMVKLGVKTENDFIGVNSGVMDQFAVELSQKNHAILLNAETLDYDLVPLDLQDNLIVIMNTNKRRELADSKYNERRSECDQALHWLQGQLEIKSLGDLDTTTLDEYSYLLPQANLLKRSRHAVWENQRTLLAKAALQNGDLVRFGHLLNASHVSLEADYEVTGKELDTLVHAAWDQAGTLGARMTGAGFGGCAIALVKRDQVAAFKDNVAERYEREIGYAPSFYLAETADGAKVLQ
ncbi:galactokinase [Lactobacillus xylocopicola]|uniref:Galactokinase n=1 Tax=Lactobacillus xylocopicola TaxID=2976676 RepID=A0ABM8BHT4_9LACO|nr:galactokinase [Lactobacillus xylocopicola]BDR60848.1 galactokinase [Lactobacillus xylocopicola]